MVSLLVIFTIILFIATDLVVRWVETRSTGSVLVSKAKTTGVSAFLVPLLQPQRFGLLGGLFFHRGHTWAKPLSSGQAKLGVDDFTQELLGRVDGIALPPVGVEIKQGQPFAAIRQGRRRALLVAPVSGLVCAVNGELAKAPGLVKRDPYTRGWLVTVRLTNLTSDLSCLRTGEAALAWLKGELAGLQEYLKEILRSGRDTLVGATAADGGLVTDGLLEHLSDEAWAGFQSRFLGP